GGRRSRLPRAVGRLSTRLVPPRRRRLADKQHRIESQKNPSDSQPVPAAKLALTLRDGVSTTCTEPSPWQATNSSSPRNTMSIGCEPTLIAVCSRNDRSIRLTVSLLKVG